MTLTSRRGRIQDLFASLVVFLVALPLCIGIAVACGVPPERGLVTGIIGGILVGALSGAPLLVSGPAASLIVLVTDVIREHGIGALAPVVALAGVWQAAAGLSGLGRWFRAVAPAVIQGMLMGIGLLILVSQLHVCLDADPRGTFVDNIMTIPASLARAESLGPLLISSTTIALIVVWKRAKPRALALVPSQLVALLVVTVATTILSPDVAFLDISPRFIDGLAPASLTDFAALADFELVGISFVFAFVASAATLLTANAIDQRQTRSKANYDREMFAQGIGNLVTGVVGGLPMTGVIVRSSVNVDAGARTRASAILHGIWILMFVLAAPQALELLPQASLGAILVYTGYRLIDRSALIGLYRHGPPELAICLVTLFGVVFIDLFVGILAGLAAALVKIVYTFARLDLRHATDPERRVQNLHLAGSATFLQVPRLAAALDAVPDDCGLHVHIDRLDHIDHACLQVLSSWNRRRESEGLPGMVVRWDELTERYRHALVGGGARQGPTMHAVMRSVWDEWMRIYAPKRREPATTHDDLIDASRVRVNLEARTIDDVLTAAADLLAGHLGQPAPKLADALRGGSDDLVALGGGVSVPHAPIRGLTRSVAALLTTKTPIDVSGRPVDIFFVLLSPLDDPRQHLQALARVGRICHDRILLEGLRVAVTPSDAARRLRASERTAARAQAPTDAPGALAVLELDETERADQVARLITQVLGRHTVRCDAGSELATALRRVLVLDPTSHIVVTVLAQDLRPTMDSLLVQEQRLAGGTPCRVHVLRPDVPGHGV